MSKSPVIVLDFSEAGGNFTQLGVALADKFSEELAARAAGFEVLDRTEFRDNLASQRIKPSALQDKGTARCSADTAGADLLIVGMLTPTSESVFVRLQIVRVEDGKDIGDVSQLVPLPIGLRELVGKPVPSLPPVPLPDLALPRPGSNGIGIPSCEYCPAPGITEAAQKFRLSGSVILRVTVTPDGQAEHILTEFGAPCGMTDQAIRTVKMWRFKPATGADGRPVSATTEIEIQFHTM